MSDIQSICVYCGSSAGDSPVFKEQAETLGRLCADAGVRLVYGGGKLGLMGATAGAARDAGGKVFGVIPEFLVTREGVLEDVDHEIVVTMHERKLRMFDESDAFCILPGGIGTLEELVETLSWARLDLHRKPMILVDIEGYWAPFKTLLEHVVEHGFAPPALLNDFCLVDRVEDVIPKARRMRLGALL